LDWDSEWNSESSSHSESGESLSSTGSF